MLGGVRHNDVFANGKTFVGKLQGEYGVVSGSGKSAALIEVKYAVHPSDTTKPLPGVGNCRAVLPQQMDFDVYGAAAGF